MELKTPLYDCHVAAGGKIVPFAGYLLPIQYQAGLIREHMAVRTACGMFDVSHMGEVILKGPDALKNVQLLVTNDCGNMVDGQVKYSPMCNESGGVVDDVLVYRIDENCFMLVVNAANREKDIMWMKSHVGGDVQLMDISDSIGQIAVQGPASPEVIKAVMADEERPKKYYTFTKEAQIAGKMCLVSRTGYTGEMGYEIYCAAKDAPAIWDALLEAGADKGLTPCGLGARDTLRMEASMPLYGHEMDETVTPLEADLDIFVKLEKEGFIGKSALVQAGAPKRRRVGFAVTGRGIARERCDAYVNGEKVGVVTSGTHCPYLNAPMGMALIQSEHAVVGTKLEIDVRGRKIPAQVVPLPLYKKPAKK